MRALQFLCTDRVSIVHCPCAMSKEFVLAAYIMMHSTCVLCAKENIHSTMHKGGRTARGEILLVGTIAIRGNGANLKHYSPAFWLDVGVTFMRCMILKTGSKHLDPNRLSIDDVTSKPSYGGASQLSFYQAISAHWLRTWRLGGSVGWGY